jgi:hypothetical protein
MECGVDPYCKPSIYKKFCEVGCLFKGEVPFAAKCMDGTGMPREYVRVQHLSGKINFANYSLMSKCSESCILPDWFQINL